MHLRLAIIRRFLIAAACCCAAEVFVGPSAAASDDSGEPAISFEFQDGQLVDSFERFRAIDGATRAKSQPALSAATQVVTAHHETALVEAVEDTTNSGERTASGGVIRRAVAVIPDYLPEGMIPAITGPTSESHRASAAGSPLTGSSWLTNSHSAGMFLGPIGGAALIDDHLEQSIGGLFGLRFGIDYDHRWGLEKRFGFAQMNVSDLVQNQRQTVSLELGDVDWMFYPWGDTLWRPYLSTGIGLAHFNYESETGRHIDRLLIGLPFGIGLKYFWNEGVAVRCEIVDNLMLGTREISTMNNLAVLLGVEFRYSGFHFGYES